MVNITKAYAMGSEWVPVLKGINMHIRKGEQVAIMGPSGSGKSTLLNILGLLDNYDSGEFYIDDILVKNLSARQSAQFRNQLIGFVFQSFNLLQFKSAAENVALPLYYQKVSRKVRNRKALEYLEMVGLENRSKHLPNELSGGQKQRVAIARALITNPKLILADEPTGALDSTTSEEIMQVLKMINQRGVTIIIVTHDIEVAKQADRIIHLKDGLITSQEDTSLL